MKKFVTCLAVVALAFVVGCQSEEPSVVSDDGDAIRAAAEQIAADEAEMASAMKETE